MSTNKKYLATQEPCPWDLSEPCRVYPITASQCQGCQYDGSRLVVHTNQPAIAVDDVLEIIDAERKHCGCRCLDRVRAAFVAATGENAP